MSRWLPVVNPREAELLAELGAVEGRDYRLWPQPPAVEIWPSTIARLTVYPVLRSGWTTTGGNPE